MGALTATGLPDARRPFEPLFPGSAHVANTNAYRPEHPDPAEAERQRADHDGQQQDGDRDVAGAEPTGGETDQEHGQQKAHQRRTLGPESPAVSAHAVAVPQPGRPIHCSDSFTAHVRFGDAVGTLVYSGSGDPRLPKERLEAFGGGAAAVLDDFRVLTVHRGGKRREWKSSHDKGHRAEIRRFLATVAGEAEPPPAWSYVDSTRLTLALADSLRTGRPVDMSAGAHQAQPEP